MHSQDDFKRFFKKAMGKDVDPYPYQLSLASAAWPEVLNIPTGIGKTAGIILSWLFKRLRGDPDTPRRLVYCLPMRVLVEQTVTNARNWIENLKDPDPASPNQMPSVHVLMGGEVDKEWDRFPENDVILVGTQDMVLSRALNRGYAMSRFRWPVQFGLLNNDCMWVFDEIQLMGAGLATSAQLQAFREKMGTLAPVRSVWMSATLQKDWLETVDFEDRAKSLEELDLSTADKKHPRIEKRINASKSLEKAPCSADDPKEIAELILEKHKDGTRTLAIVNRVKRAIDIYQALKRKKIKVPLTLVHSRFRPPDRQAALNRLLENPGPDGSICISTQVVEAGVDISAETLITDLAPWPSMIQRFGRCNRNGESDDASVIWLDINLDKKGAALPYEEADLKKAASVLENLDNVRINQLPSVHLKHQISHVLRRKDLVDLFDTTPDLSGLDIDISRFIREANENDCYVFWRDFKEERPDDQQAAPFRDELCAVPVGELKGKDDLRLWWWDHLEKRWERPASITPGMTFMLHKSMGCYSPEYGWTGSKADIPEIIEPANLPVEADTDDIYVCSNWQTLAEHTDAVVKELESILQACELPEEYREILLSAARWHDAGKAHEVFQKAMVGDPPENDVSKIWAKTARRGLRYIRKGFRHELASALVMLENELPDLAAYLAAAHHGKVRLSIRSLPHENPPGTPGIRFARGIWEGDVIPEA